MVNLLRLTLAVVLVTATGLAHADMSQCNMKKLPDDRWECMAHYSGSATFCDRIQNWERRNHCVRKVIRKQRSQP
jgi:hypothetical protein